MSQSKKFFNLPTKRVVTINPSQESEARQAYLKPCLTPRQPPYKLRQILNKEISGQKFRNGAQIMSNDSLSFKRVQDLKTQENVESQQIQQSSVDIPPKPLINLTRNKIPQSSSLHAMNQLMVTNGKWMLPVSHNRNRQHTDETYKYKLSDQQTMSMTLIKIKELCDKVKHQHSQQTSRSPRPQRCSAITEYLMAIPIRMRKRGSLSQHDEKVKKLETPRCPQETTRYQPLVTAKHEFKTFRRRFVKHQIQPTPILKNEIATSRTWKQELSFFSLSGWDQQDKEEIVTAYGM